MNLEGVWFVIESFLNCYEMKTTPKNLDFEAEPMY